MRKMIAVTRFFTRSMVVGEPVKTANSTAFVAEPVGQITETGSAAALQPDTGPGQAIAHTIARQWRRCRMFQQTLENEICKRTKMMKYLMKLTLPVAATLAAAPVWAETDGNGWHSGQMMNGHGIFGVLAMVVFWGVIITVIVLAVRWFGDRRKKDEDPDALSILKARLARGEIEPEDYEIRRKVLEG